MVSKYLQNFRKKFSYSSLEKFREDYREPVYPEMYSFLGFDWNNEKEIIWREYVHYKKILKLIYLKELTK